MMQRLRDAEGSSACAWRSTTSAPATRRSATCAQFPFDLLKIDKSFIDDVGATSREKELTRAIIELGKTLDLELVAEGIERNDQLARLKILECELGQGFYFSNHSSTPPSTAYSQDSPPPKPPTPPPDRSARR